MQQARRGIPIVEEGGMDMGALTHTLEQINQRLTHLEGRQEEPRLAHGRRERRRYGQRDHDSDEDTNPFHDEELSDDEERPRRRETRHQDPHVKVDIPEFDGRAQGDSFIDWLYTVERVFEYKDFTENKKVKLIAIKLKGYASLWWENVKRERQREGRRPIATWEKMKREMKRRFMPDTYKQDNFLKFHNFKQLDLSVEDYTREFEHLMLKCDLVEPEEQTIVRYLGGLKKDISDVIKLQPYWTFNDVRKMALTVEQQKKEARRFASRSFAGSSSSKGTTSLTPTASTTKATSSKVVAQAPKQVVNPNST